MNAKITQTYIPFKYFNWWIEKDSSLIFKVRTTLNRKGLKVTVIC